MHVKTIYSARWNRALYSSHASAVSRYSVLTQRVGIWLTSKNEYEACKFWESCNAQWTLSFLEKLDWVVLKLTPVDMHDIDH